ncbi:MAG TPA: sensor histidine kinase [Streptosporangiaceae bacterium]|nr:sensor histidine kinase [Streptosporangiaceae bacterium]
MLRTVNLVSRVLGFAWVGVLAFVLAPPHGAFNLPVQIAGYCLAGAALLAWALVDNHPAAARYRGRGLPVTFGAMAVAAGFACAAGGGGTVLVVFGFIAALGAGGELGLAAALGVTAAGILAIEVGGLIFGDSYGGLLGLPAIVLAGLVIGRNRGAYRVQAEQAAALLAQRERLQAEQRRADLLEERARIAREIHDVLAHSLGALGIQIQAARAVLTDHADTDKACEILAAAQRMAAEGLVETRRAVQALRADTLPLDEEVALVSDTYAQRYHVAVSFDTGGIPGPLPPDATIALLRIAQEALVNAAKHAAGQGVAVRLDYGDADVRLTVRNDLDPGTPGADHHAGVSTVNGGYGLTGMRERLRLLNGTLEAGRRDNQWVVTAELLRPQPENMRS